jgi:hypothetical protein
MSERNGSRNSPTSVVARSVTEFAHDVLTLTELQADLFKMELQQFRRAVVLPVALLLTAVVVAFGCVPVVLLCLAYSLVEFAGMSQALSLLIAVLFGATVAVLAAFLGWRRLRSGPLQWERSREEFGRNVAWVKQVLKQKSRPPLSDCEPMPSGGRRRESWDS